MRPRRRKSKYFGYVSCGNNKYILFRDSRRRLFKTKDEMKIFQIGGTRQYIYILSRTGPQKYILPQSATCFIIIT